MGWECELLAPLVGKLVDEVLKQAEELPNDEAHEDTED